MTGGKWVVHRLGLYRLERERSRDGSCLNVSAVERNRKRISEIDDLFVDENGNVIVFDTETSRRLLAQRILERLKA
jgi:hypothetical protein